MSRETVLTAVRDLVLAWTPDALNLRQLTRGYAYPYDETPANFTEFPVLIVERNRAKSAFSNMTGSAPNGGACREELLPIRIDVAWKVWDQDKPNIHQTEEAAVLAWEDEFHALFAANPNINGTVVKLGEIGAARQVETKVGLRFWYDQELLVAAAFIDALYEVTTS